MATDIKTGLHRFAVTTGEAGLGPLLIGDSPMTLAAARAEIQRLFTRGDVPAKLRLITYGPDDAVEVHHEIKLEPRELTRGTLRGLLSAVGYEVPEARPEDTDPNRLGNRLGALFQNPTPLKQRTLGEQLQSAFLDDPDDAA
jgi:hypothetical protein